ncbi:hypothetical protein HKD24_14755 [Gluconobacter sp. LMG 31484]|uniref:Uncharacterized protein n=1 Tax=Gluconobacter vitians TaxID=2728102 RepID=A0ABR9Y919_9PROT|nr:hypothetical protein [Gluconobacter vitians]MBF0860434.1 hypothetical protein [Gluconobacter vitians]
MSEARKNDDADLAERYRTMMAQNRARSEKHREEQRAKGLVRVSGWIHPSHRDEFKAWLIGKDEPKP